MSFKKFSVSQSDPSNGTPDDKTKTAQVGDQPTTQPAKKQDEAAPAHKS